MAANSSSTDSTVVTGPFRFAAAGLALFTGGGDVSDSSGVSCSALGDERFDWSYSVCAAGPLAIPIRAWFSRAATCSGPLIRAAALTTRTVEAVLSLLSFDTDDDRDKGSLRSIFLEFRPKDNAILLWED